MKTETGGKASQILNKYFASKAMQLGGGKIGDDGTESIFSSEVP